MTKISINGKYLHELQMRLKGEQKNGTCYLSYPEQRIKAEVKKNKVFLHIPPLLTIALFQLTFWDKDEISIKIKNKDFGLFKMIDLKYPDELYDDRLVDITFKSVNKL